ncbi:MAG: hypothetical protein IJA94_00320 [Bacilli bacterium]|nr:hypothetical protein [Bacilli bacterium]
MKKKNGFMFVETIVTLTVLITVLLLLYNVFVNLLGNEKRVTDYEKKGYRYALFYIKEWLIANDVDLSADKVFIDTNRNDNNFKVLASYINKQSDGEARSFTDWVLNSDNTESKFNVMANTYNLKTLVILRCKAADGGKIDNEKLKNEMEAQAALLTNEFMEYILSLGACENYNDKYQTYRIIGEFQDSNTANDDLGIIATDYQAFIYYPNLKEGY